MNGRARPASPALFERMFRPRLARPTSPLDAVAALNVLLLGAFFFLAHSPFMLQPGLSIELPETSFEDGQTYDALIVAVASDEMVFVGDRRVSMDDLPAIFAAVAAARPDRGVIVQADRRVSHGALMSLVDTARRSGLTRILLASRAPPPLRGRAGADSRRRPAGRTRRREGRG